MMKYTLTFLFLMTSYTYAFEGIISVLEAPLFKKPSKDSVIYQYAKKGDKLYIHTKEVETPEKNESNFYQVLGPSGQKAYILKKHFIILYNDKREFTQKVIKNDSTDYRLQEPLGDKYPFFEKSGYRGKFQVALGQSNYSPYPFNQSILDSNFDLAKDFSFTYSQIADEKLLDQRLFFGATGGAHSSKQTYILTSQVASMENTRLYIGPYLSYDVYRTKKHELSFNTSFHFYFYDLMEIGIKDNTTKNQETREYQNSFSIVPNIGGAFSFKESFLDFDTLVGFNIKGIPPKTYKAVRQGEETDLWASTSEKDSFKQTFNIELSYSISIQATY